MKQLNRLAEAHLPNSLHRFQTIGLMTLLCIFMSGCFYSMDAARYFNRITDGSVPWWCQGTPDLSELECRLFSIHMDSAVEFAEQRWTYQDGLNAGGTPLFAAPWVLDFGLTSVFNPDLPNTIWYTGDAPDARATNVSWRIIGPGTPEGFAGARDVWAADVLDPSISSLVMWPLRGFENQPNVFSPSHPCVNLTLNSTSDQCYKDSHPVPLEILIVNDDGYNAEGIDALVEALTDDPNDPSDTFVEGINVTVVAPLTQQSGQGGNETPGGAPAATEDLTTNTTFGTESGYPVLAAVHGTPADAVSWALDTLKLDPDLVISGINEGQNLSTIGHTFSGTIGAARKASKRMVPALATSQELKAGHSDFSAGVAATLDLLEAWRIGAAGMPLMRLPNINIPTCNNVGTIRPSSNPLGYVETVVAPVANQVQVSDCLSVDDESSITDDVDALRKGFIGVADMGTTEPPNF